MQRKTMSITMIMALALVTALLMALPCAAYLPTDLGVTGGYTYSEAYAINASGTVVGECVQMTDVGEETNTTGRLAVIWQSGETSPSVLPLLAGCTYSTARGINSSGTIVGMCSASIESYGTFIEPQICIWPKDPETGDPMDPVLVSAGEVPIFGSNIISDAGHVIGRDSDYDGFVWLDGNKTMLSTAGTGAYDTTIDPIAVTAGGQVIGEAYFLGKISYNPDGSPSGYSYWPEAMLWKDDAAIRLVTPPEGVLSRDNSSPHGINSSGQVIGQIGTNGYDTDAIPFIWLPTDPDGTGPLTAGLNEFGDMLNTTFSAINNSGQIAMYWENADNGIDVAIMDLADVSDVAARTTLGSLPYQSLVFNMVLNSGGTLAGTCQYPIRDLYNEDYGYRQLGFFGSLSMTPDANGSQLRFAYGLGGMMANLYSLNANGVMAGGSTLPGDTGYHACLLGTERVAGDNMAPFIAVYNDPGGVVGSPITFTALGLDPDGDAITFSLGSNAPAGAVIDPTTGDFSWTPTTVGPFSFDVKVTDAYGLFATETVSGVVDSALYIFDVTALRKGKTVTVTAKIGNRATTTAENVTVNTATLGGINSSSVPVSLRTMRLNTSKRLTLKFLSSSVPTTEVELVIEGTSSLGDFSTTQMITVP